MPEIPESVRISQLEAENADLKADISHAMKEAKRRVPDYPFSQNTASECVWALGQSLLGINAALEEWIGQVYDRHELLREVFRVLNLPHVEASAELKGLSARIVHALALPSARAAESWARKKILELTASTGATARRLFPIGQPCSQEKVICYCTIQLDFKNPPGLIGRSLNLPEVEARGQNSIEVEANLTKAFSEALAKYGSLEAVPFNGYQGRPGDGVIVVPFPDKAVAR